MTPRSDTGHSRSSRDDSARPSTLPGHLARWATERPRAIALRHKARGVWTAWTWSDLRAEVMRLAAALAARGFEPEDAIVVAAGPSPPALAASLAAQSLGGAAWWLAPQTVRRPGAIEATPTFGARSANTPRFAFAEDEVALAAVHMRLGSGAPWALALVTAEHAAAGEGAASAVRAYADVVGQAHLPGDAASPAADRDVAAFVFSTDGGGTALTQSEAVAAARRWLEVAHVDARVQAFASEGPTTAPNAIFLAGWLVGGFTLGLPEDATTSDADRRELQPTVVAASGGALERLWLRIVDGLPASGTLVRRIVNAGLAASDHGFRGLAGWWLVRRPLRRVLGLGETRVTLALGGAPVPAAAQTLFAQLRVSLGALPTANLSRAELAVFSSVADAATRFDPALALGAAAPRRIA